MRCGVFANAIAPIDGTDLLNIVDCAKGCILARIEGILKLLRMLRCNQASAFMRDDGKMNNAITLSESPLQVLEAEVQPLIERLWAHPLFDRIRTLDDVQCLMEHHVYAVWDFMCLKGPSDCGHVNDCTVIAGRRCAVRGQDGALSVDPGPASSQFRRRYSASLGPPNPSKFSTTVIVLRMMSCPPPAVGLRAEYCHAATDRTPRRQAG